MGAAHYKAGQYSQALASFSRVQAGSEDSAQDANRTARTAYNRGNTQYQIGAQAEAQNPQAALNAYAHALASYRRALGADPTDQDAKFNYEFVTKKIEALQEQLEEQPQHNQPSQPNHPEQPEQPEQEAQPQADNRQPQQDQTGEQPPDTAQAEQERQAGQDQPNEMSEDEAQAVIDTARNEELSPEEFTRQAQRGSLAEPVQDW